MESGMKEVLLEKVNSQVGSIKPTPKITKPVAQIELKEPPD